MGIHILIIQHFYIEWASEGSILLMILGHKSNLIEKLIYYFVNPTYGITTIFTEIYKVVNS